MICTRTQGRQGTPARSDSRTSLVNVPATCVQEARIGYIQDGLVYINLRKADWTRYRQEIECKLSSSHPTDCQKAKKLFRATLLKAASHHIPTGSRRLYMLHVPAESLAMVKERDDLRKQDPASPRLSTRNDGITKATSDHKRR